MILLCLCFEPSANMQIKGNIIAYCDLFNTKMVGFFTAFEQGDSYNILYYENVGSYLNTMGAALTSEVKLFEHDFDILLDEVPEAAYCQDFSKNNYNDLMIVTKSDNFDVFLYFQTENEVFKQRKILKNLEYRPFPINIADHSVSDLVFADRLRNKLVYLENTIFNNYSGCLLDVSNCFAAEQDIFDLPSKYEFTDRSAIYQIDLNGDCTAEFAVLVRSGAMYYMEFLAKTMDSDLQVTMKSLNCFPLAETIGTPYFFDVNTNSNLDMMVPECSEDGCKLVVYYNKGKPICPGQSSKDNCRPKSEICTGDPNWGFEVDEDAMDWISIPNIDLNGLVSAQDYNLERHPSIFVSTMTGIFEITTLPIEGAREVQGVTLSPGVNNERFSQEDLAGFTHVVPVDLIGRGWFIFAFSMESGSCFYLHEKSNELGFFLRAEMLTDRCFDKCPSSEPRRSYSTFVPGGTFKYVTSDVSNTPKTGIMTVLGEPVFVELPYIEFGVATVSEYIDEFAAGTSGRWEEFSGIVPNSALWVVTSGHTWKVVVYLEDVSKSMLSVTIATIIVFICFCTLLLALIWYENRSDKKEAMRMNEQFE